MWLSDTQKIGVGLTSFGVIFMFLGVLLLFDSGLIAIGNILFVCGLPLIIGTQRTIAFLSSPNKIRGSVCFILGIILVLIKYTIIGMIIEVFGFINLFGDFFPAVVSFLRGVPFIGTVLSLPVVARVIDRIAGINSPV